VKAGVVSRLRFEDLVVGRAVAERGREKVEVDYRFQLRQVERVNRSAYHYSI
jgi:hypothetical protein